MSLESLKNKEKRDKYDKILRYNASISDKILRALDLNVKEEEEMHEILSSYTSSSFISDWVEKNRNIKG
jgi:hypothetical protein